MKDKRILLFILLLCLLLSACGTVPAEAPAEPPVQEESLPPESSASPVEKPETAEPEINFIKGYSLKEMGFSVVFPEWLSELEDPNETAAAQPFFKENSNNENLYAPSFLNGNCTTVDISVAESTKSYGSYTLRILQCYKPEELAGEKDRVRFYDRYLDLSELEALQIYRTDEIMICDLTDLFYIEGKAMEGTYYSFNDYLSLTNAHCLNFYGYDNSWLLDLYNYFGDSITEMVYDAEGNSLIHYERMKDWRLADGSEANDITFRFVDRNSQPVSGLYIDLHPRIILAPDEKRPDIGPSPVLTGQTDQNGEITWKNYFPCHEGEEYILSVTSASAGSQNYTNTAQYILPNLSKLGGSYTAEYLWEKVFGSTTEEYAFWKTLEGYWNGPKNRFVIFDFNEQGQPVFASGLYDAGGGRGYGTVIRMEQTSDQAAVIDVYYPEHPESVMMGYIPAETVQLIIDGNPAAEDSLMLQYPSYDKGSFYRAGSDFDTAYNAYAAIHHNW